MADESNNSKSSKFQLDVRGQAPDMRANIQNMKQKANFGNRQDDTTIVNSDGANASVRLTDNKINLASAMNAGMKLNDQQQIQRSFEEKHTTNRLNMETYDILVNGHKLNPGLWEYSDFSKFVDQYGSTHAIGGFCMFGTILTPSWDEQLHRYVLIRRLARMPMFSPAMNVPEILNTLNIEDPTKVSFKYGYKQHTESAEEFQKKMAATLKKENEDGDAPETAPNGRHYFESDIKELMDKNEGMTREQAIEQLSKEDKYTKEWKKSNDAANSKSDDAKKDSSDGSKDSASSDGASGSKRDYPLTDAECEKVYDEMARTAPDQNSNFAENAKNVISHGKSEGRIALSKEFLQLSDSFEQQGQSKWATWAYHMSSYVLQKLD